MAFTSNSLVAFGTGSALTAGERRSQVFFYRSADSQSAIATADYFLSVYDRLGVGDVIMVVGASGGTETLSTYVVQTCTSAAVTITLSVATAAS